MVNQRKECELHGLLHCSLFINMHNDRQQQIHPPQKSLAGCQGTTEKEFELFLYVPIRDSPPS